MEEPPFVPTSDSPNRTDPQLDLLVPTNPNQPYDIKELILSVADDNNFFEVQEEYAKNIVIGYIRLNGKTIGVVANQPAALAGTLDINASVKAARFVRFCDAFNIPLLTLVDVPGFLPGVIQKVYVKTGDEVKIGTPLCVLVAMKMENEIRSPIDGIVRDVYVTESNKVLVNDKMLVVE
ncbi:Biotin-requiring enzyme [Parabacteroides chinchillae]|uniref:Biotin-requiring enzyme n=1 Tax=Parabacteroides chinchillae TaxID=871327 RepID=A0A8G2F566_9BACT|nr:Biotin-requiring enzyme [Parabacteroides chinchillae]